MKFKFVEIIYNHKKKRVESKCIKSERIKSELIKSEIIKSELIKSELIKSKTLKTRPKTMQKRLRNLLKSVFKPIKICEASKKKIYLLFTNAI